MKQILVIAAGVVVANYFMAFVRAFIKTVISTAVEGK